MFPGYRASVFGKAGDIPSQSCMIYCEIFRDRGITDIARTVSHEVGHCLGLWHSEYDPETGFEADRDGIMKWEDTAGHIPCKKQWYDLLSAHTIPDRFSDYHINELRSSTVEQP